MNENQSPLFRPYKNNSHRNSDEFLFPTLASLKRTQKPEAEQQQQPQAEQVEKPQAEQLEHLQQPDQQASQPNSQPPSQPASQPLAEQVEPPSQQCVSGDMLSLIPLTEQEEPMSPTPTSPAPPTPEPQPAMFSQLMVTPPSPASPLELASLPPARISVVSLRSEFGGLSPGMVFRRGEEEEPGDFLEFVLSQTGLTESQSEWESRESETKRRRMDVERDRDREIVLLQPEQVFGMLELGKSVGETSVFPRIFGSLSGETDNAVFLLTEQTLHQLELALDRELLRSAAALTAVARSSRLTEEMSARREDAEFVRKTREHAQQVELQIGTRMERKYVEIFELGFGQYLKTALTRKGVEGASSGRAKRELREELVGRLAQLAERVERRRTSVQMRVREVEQQMARKGEEIRREVEMKRSEKAALTQEIAAYEKAVEDQKSTAKDVYVKKSENFRLCKEHFQNHGWTVCRDGMKEMVVQLPRVRLHFQVISDDRGHRRTVEYKRLAEGPFDFLNSALVNFPLTTIARTLVEAKLPSQGTGTRFSFAPEKFSDWASDAIRTASAIEELAWTVQNVGELLEANRWIDREKSMVNIRLISTTASTSGPKRSHTLTFHHSATAAATGGVAIEVWVCNYKQQLRLTFGAPTLALTDSETLAQELTLNVRVVGPCNPDMKAQIVENLRTTKAAWTRRIDGIESAVDAALKLFKYW